MTRRALRIKTMQKHAFETPSFKLWSFGFKRFSKKLRNTFLEKTTQDLFLLLNFLSKKFVKSELG